MLLYGRDLANNYLVQILGRVFLGQQFAGW